MALKIRLRRQGQRNRPFYRIVVADEHAPREGRYLENIGWYNPLEKSQESVAQLSSERVSHWLRLGAQMTDGVFPLVKKLAPEVVQFLQEQKKRKLTKRRSQRRSSPRNAV